MSDKKPSGAQYRKQKKLELEQSRKNEQARKNEAPQRLSLAKPPVGNPTAGVAYAHDVLLCALDEVNRDTVMTSEQRWNYIQKLSAAIGMTHSKALMQQELLDLRESEEPEHDEELEPNPLQRQTST